MEAFLDAACGVDAAEQAAPGWQGQALPWRVEAPPRLPPHLRDQGLGLQKAPRLPSGVPLALIATT